MPPSRGRQALRHLPLASAISAVLAGVPVARAAEAGRRRARGSRRHGAEARREPAGRAGQHPGARHREARGAAHRELRRLRQVPARASTFQSLGQGGNGVGTTHVYMRGVASGDDGNHSGSAAERRHLPRRAADHDDRRHARRPRLRHRARRGARRARRARCTARARRPARSASSPTSPIRAASRPATTSSVNTVAHGGIGYVGRRLRQHAAVADRGGPPGRLGRARRRLHRQRRGHQRRGRHRQRRALVPDLGRSRRRPGRHDCGQRRRDHNAHARTTTTTSTPGRPRGAASFDLDDNWTVTPSFMGQALDANGFFGYDPPSATCRSRTSAPRHSTTRSRRSALTVEGKIGDFDIVYAGAYMKRNDHSIADYSRLLVLLRQALRAPAPTGPTTTCTARIAMPQEFVDRGEPLREVEPRARVYDSEGPIRSRERSACSSQRQLHDIWEQYMMPGVGGKIYGGNAQGFDPFYSIPGLAEHDLAHRRAARRPRPGGVRRR